MKFNESFEQPNNPEDSIEEIIKAQKILLTYNKMREKLSELDPDLVKLIRATLKEKVYKKVYKDLENKYDELSEKSEELIESPNSETPEIRKEREEIKDKLNEIMNLQESMQPLIDEIERSEFIIDKASKEDFKEAESVIAELDLELRSTKVDQNLN
jgi:DNA repair exonuclease SbcCD ATPase subunit